MKLTPTLLCFLILFFCPSLSFAQQNQVYKTVLSNGLTVLIQEMPASEITSIYACVKTGSALEGQYLGKGISHFVEHMLFKGTTKRPVGSIAQEVKNLGGSINAITSFDYTMYTLDVPKGSFNQGLDIISDMLMNSAFDPKEMEKERQVIHGEMRLYNDRPDRQLNDLVFHNVFKQHPYQHPPIGYPQLFDTISRQEIYQYYQQRYIPNNIIISIAGNVKAGVIIPLIQKAFKDFKPGAYVERNLPQEPPQVFQRYLQKEYPTNLMRFSLAYEGVSVLDPDLYALDVLAMALGQGASSRLYKEIYRKRHLVEEDISVENFTPQDRGIFEIQGTMSQDHLNDVLACLNPIIHDIQTNGLTQEELEKTKRQVEANFIYENQTAPSLATRAALDEALTGDCNFSNHYIELIKKVTNEDIKTVAKRYLQEARLNVTVLKPKQEPAKPLKEDASFQTEGIKKFVLDNGLTILIHEDHHVLLDEIKLVVHGGSRMEDDQLAGISRLTARVWPKSTSHMPEEALDLAMEKRGGHLSSSSSHNTLEMNIEVLSEDLDFALNLLEDLVKNPSFSQNALDRERQTMLTELQERQDDIMDFSSRALLETFYVKNSLHRDSWGSQETLSKIKRQDLLNFYHALMSANNMVISVFGNCQTDQVLSVLKRKFGSLNKGQVSIPLTPENPPVQTRVKELHMDKEEALLMMALPAPYLKDKDRWAMEIISNVLGGGLGGKLFVKIREQLGEAYTTGTQYAPDLDTGTFILYVLTRGEKIDSVREIVIKELEDLRIHNLSQAELETSKSYLKGRHMRSLLTNEALASTADTNELYGLGYDFYQHFDEDIDAVTPDDVRRVADRYLDVHHAAVVITKPRSLESKHE